ncbi:Macrocin-O-methyltransferase (TylF)/Methyltransferase domain containing protein [Novymonas esmeraldas]|uniref:Macrocin-O-methyltransferase (TylF)/Methyltransferase domain containing protein n=1 Tax=Novymonas esmeraldas TaxID=1808958 RepID=A0AAW0EL84_9TRYP
MRRAPPLCCGAAAAAVAAVEDCLRAIRLGRAEAALPRLNELKATSRTVPGVDYARALCFLSGGGTGDVLAARQSVLEELRLHPEHVDAQALLHEINAAARPLLSPPSEVCRAHPLFALLFDALLDHTMLMWPRLLHLFQATERLARLDGADGSGSDAGHIVECGTAGGGSAVLMAVVLAEAEAALGSCTTSSRRVLALDSFTGMPAPTVRDCLARVHPGSPPEQPHDEDEATASWGAGTCRSPAAHVRQLARAFAVEDRLVVIEGLFSDSIPEQLLPRQDVQRDGIALLHIDADWYDSTRVPLELLVPVMRQPAAGGGGGACPHRVVQVDDYYYWQGCRDAVDEYLAKTEAAAVPPTLLCDVDDNAVWFAVSRGSVVRQEADDQLHAPPHVPSHNTHAGPVGK